MAFYKEGLYSGKIIENGVGESEKKGTPFIFIRFMVVSQADGEAVKQQYERTYRKYITEGTIKYVAQDIKRLGIKDLNSFVQMDPNVKNGKNLAGQTAVFACKHEDGDHGPNEKWEVPMGGGNDKAVKKIEREGLLKLHAKFGAAFAEAMVDEDNLPY